MRYFNLIKYTFYVVIPCFIMGPKSVFSQARICADNNLSSFTDNFQIIKELIIPVGAFGNKIKAAIPINSNEKLIITFCDDNWLDLTDEVVVKGGGLKFKKIVARGGATQNFKRVFCKVEFQIIAGTHPGIRKVILRRPNLLLGKDETSYEIELVPSFRFFGVKNVTNKQVVANEELYKFEFAGEGLNQINGINYPIVHPIVKTVNLLSHTNKKLILEMAFKKPEKLRFNDLLKMFDLHEETIGIYVTNKSSVIGSEDNNSMFTIFPVTGSSNLQGTLPAKPNIPKVIVGNDRRKSDLLVDFKNIFYSLEAFSDFDIGNYKLCGGGNAGTFFTKIDELIIVVTNVGDTASSNTNLIFNANGNTNFTIQNQIFQVNTLLPEMEQEFIVRRKTSNICSSSFGGNNKCIRCGDLWSDKNISAKLNGVDSNPDNDEKTIH